MDLAERLGKTHAELLTGVAGPLSNREFVLWSVRAARASQLAEVS